MGITGEAHVVVGARLREARRRIGWSLADVENASGGEFRASAVGAYERGERAISAVRLARLLRLYGVSSALILDNLPDADVADGLPEPEVIDLTALENERADAPEVVEKALDVIRSLRRTPGSPSVRRSDLRVLAALTGSASLPGGEPPRESSAPSV